MGEKFGAVLDITIAYPDGTPDFWQFLQGRLPRVIVQARTLAVPRLAANTPGDTSQALRALCEDWINQLWVDKDALLDKLLANKAE
jgi:hypothetical protein